MRAPALLALLLACGSPGSRFEEIEREVTRPGDTCGEWFHRPGKTSESRYVNAKCADGMVCAHEVETHRLDESGGFDGRFGICTPKEALICDALGASTCPPGTGCWSDDNHCHFVCRQHSDCVGELQICASRCEIRSCPAAPDGGPASTAPCAENAHCRGGLCLRD